MDKRVFDSIHTIAIVGLSDKPHRPSYGVAEYLIKQGYKIIPINPLISDVFGIKSYASLLDVPKDIQIDVVDIFRQSEHMPEIVNQAIKIKAGMIWMQEGIDHPDAADNARRYGIKVVANMCMMKFHQRVNSE